jgi:5-methyltetrahydrofolate--homocysteine methyltransferase
VENNRKKIEEILSRRILVLDGGMGTMAQQYKLQESDYRGERFRASSIDLKGNNDLLILSRPSVIQEIHEAYLSVGADIIETDTLNANAVSLAEYGLQNLVYELNFEGAKLARKTADKFSTADKRRFVAGSIGPTSKSLSMSPDVSNPASRSITFDKLYAAYVDQIKGLVDGGVDMLLIETIFDTLNAKVALAAIQDYNQQNGYDIPIMVSGTLSDSSGRTLSGQTLEAFYTSVSHVNLLSVGLNCGLGAKQMAEHIAELSSYSKFHVCAYANAGYPDQFGSYNDTPESMAAYVEQMLKGGMLNIVGGCCGTTPDHIKLIAALAEKYAPRQIPQLDKISTYSGIDVVKVLPHSNFINIGERTNVAGSKKFARLIREQKYEEALSIARQQVQDGAQLIDVCMDDAMLDAVKEITTFLNLMASEPDIAVLPVMIDSSKWEVIKAGLKCAQGKSIVNSISLKEGEEAFLSKAKYIHKLGAATVVMLFDEQGQADTYERKIEIAERSYRLLTNKIGFPPEDIIIDPNVLAISTGMEEHNDYAVAFIKTCRWIKENLPYAKISGGVSNLSFSYRGNNTVREAMHSVFLYHAIQAGMDMGIVNPGQLTVYSDIEPKLLKLTEDVVLNCSTDASDLLIAYAAQLANNSTGKEEKKEEGWRKQPAIERIRYAMVKGVADYVEQDIKELLPSYSSPIAIIEGPLMNGMNEVGVLFGEGKMFLPQVVKSARVMKRAVAYLEPLIQKEKEQNKTKQSPGKILLATVKGDVHDIGKNIVSVVLGCNGYEIVDLGVMVPTHKIIEVAITLKPDIVGLSGLITPSLDEMAHVAEEMNKNKLQIPLILGGAATSPLHTAVAIQPKYGKGVVHVKDASQVAGIAKKLLAENGSLYLQELDNTYEQLRISYKKQQEELSLISLVEARKNKPAIDWANEPIKKPAFLGVKVYKSYPIEELIPFINWSAFFYAWGLKGRYPDIFQHPQMGAEAKTLYDDAQLMLKELAAKKLLTANAVVGIFPAASKDEDILIYTDELHASVQATLYTLRNQQKKEEGNNCNLADFIAPAESKKADYIGAFAATAGIGVNELVEEYSTAKDEYKALLVKLLANRLVEAFSELLHLKVNTELWQLPEEVEGIRPAIGYPVCPVHNEKRTVFDLLNTEKNTGIELTDGYVMNPIASVCGLYFASPHAHYFSVGPLKEDQIELYAKRRNIALEEAENLLSQNRLE